MFFIFTHNCNTIHNSSALLVFNDCFIVYCCWYRMKNHFKNRLELKRVDLSSHWFIHLLLCIRSIVSSSLWPSSLTILLLLVAFKCYLSSSSSINNCLLLCNAIVALSTFYCKTYCSKCNNKQIEWINEWMNDMNGSSSSSSLYWWRW